MKKVFLIVACLVVILFGMGKPASADLYVNTVNLDVLLRGTGTYPWSHAVTPDFQIPYDTLNSATLEIGAWFVDGSNDRVNVRGIYEGTLNNNLLWFSETDFNIGSVFTTWSSGAPLNVTLNYIETGLFGLNSLYLDYSTLRIDYTDGSGGTPVPEPTTMLLLGSGLLGVAGTRRFMKSRKK
jgi:hypothetical protein